MTQSYYDDRGQLWKTTRHEIDASDGSDDDNLEHLFWYDDEGQVIKEDGPELTKTTYDRLGRATHRFLLATDDDTEYDDVSDVVGDWVLEEHQSVYDDTSDELLMQVALLRHHDASTGTGALDSGADNDALLVTAANLNNARPQIMAYWYDRFGRQEDVVAYGTYGGSNFDRDGLSVPARSDTALRTSYSYSTAGHLEETTDPRGLVARSEVDDAGRQEKVIRNYDSSVNSGNPSGTDDNQTVKYEYTDGLQTKIIADMPSGQTDQETIYTYGTTKGASAGDSEIATGHLLQKVQYPDSSGGSDVVTYAYNALEEQVYMKDQAGNVIETELDDGGREEHRRITTLATGFDGDVRRISMAFDGSGRTETVTQYDNATVGSGSVLDQVQYSYDGWGNVTNFEQDRNGEVGASGSVDDYEVSYAYAKSTTGRNAVRRSSMTLPSGTVVTLNYSDEYKSNEASRVAKLVISETTVARYEYLGASQVVGTDYPQPDVFSRVFDPSTGDYDHLDRFNRITSNRWTSDLTTDVEFYHIDIEYDRNSNITLIEDQVHTGFDVEYTMDDLDRLIDAEEGTWSGSAITTRTRHQVWTLGHTGNWDVGKLDLDGDDNWNETDEYNDDRTHNAVNELTARDTDDNGTNDYSLTYDAVGNLTDDDEEYEYVYDPFGRLREVKNQSSVLVAEYTYNGLGFMLGVHEDTDDDGDVDGSDLWFYTAYDEAWRGVSTYRSSDSDPKEEFVVQLAGDDGRGGASYINGVVLRNKDANTAWTTASDGTLEERVYYCQNWRGDVSALVHSNRVLMEWVKYSAYGVPIGLPGADTDSDGDCDSTDITQIQTWIDTPPSPHEVRGDVDLDGDVDAGDKSTAQAYLEGTSLAWEALSAVGNSRGYGSCHHLSLANVVLSRHRALSISSGRWARRDPLGHVDGVSLYEYVASRPPGFVDPYGLKKTRPKHSDLGDGSQLGECPGSYTSSTSSSAPGGVNILVTILSEQIKVENGICFLGVAVPSVGERGGDCDAHGTVTALVVVTSGPVGGGGAGARRVRAKVDLDAACDTQESEESTRSVSLPGGGGTITVTLISTLVCGQCQ